MMDSELRSMIRREIKNQINVILSGAAGNNGDTGQTEDIQSLFPGMPTIADRPVMHPFGFVSRATSGTIQVAAKQGDHPGNRLVLGHRDAKRPALNNGEVVLYNAFGQQIRIQDGEIILGNADTTDPAVVGNELKAMLQSLITLISTHTHVGNLGYATSPPIQATQFVQVKTDNVDNDKILSQVVFIEKGA